MSEKSDAVQRRIRTFALAFPEAESRSPWPGHDDAAVRDKTFVFLSAAGEPFSMSCKLPYTGDVALELRFAAPTGYGLGKSGWVTFTPSDDELPSFEQIEAWIDESYRARAPRKLVKELDSRDSG
jgi:predicted DNA-binding protein (MmcQ/YjbR family)